MIDFSYAWTLGKICFQISLVSERSTVSAEMHSCEFLPSSSFNQTNILSIFSSSGNCENIIIAPNHNCSGSSLRLPVFQSISQPTGPWVTATSALNRIQAKPEKYSAG